MIRRTGNSSNAKRGGGGHEMYVTYDLAQKTRSGRRSTLPRVKRVHLAGDVTDWRVGHFAKRSGRKVHGVKVEYDQSRRAYRREGYRARRGRTRYQVAPARVSATRQHYTRIVEVPARARHVEVHERADVPTRYRAALHHRS